MTLLLSVLRLFERDRNWLAAFFDYNRFTVCTDPFMPNLDFVISRGNVFNCEVAVFVSDGIIGVVDSHHVSAHPSVPSVAAKLNDARLFDRGWKFHPSNGDCD